jgi:hypothetical protein
MTSLERRIEALEGPRDPQRELPHVPPDDAPQAEIDRLRRRGVEVYRFSDQEAVERFAP